MTERVLNFLFNSFETIYRETLQRLLFDQRMHMTNREALRCFFLGILVNIFSSEDFSGYLEKAYIASSSDSIFFFVVNKEVPRNDGKKSSDRMEMFVFNFDEGKQGSPEMTPRTRDNLIAMLIADNFRSLLTKKKFPKAKVTSFRQETEYYEVN